MSLREELLSERVRLEELIREVTKEKEQAVSDIDYYAATQVQAVHKRNALEAHRCSYDHRLNSVKFLLEKLEEEDESMDD